MTKQKILQKAIAKYQPNSNGEVFNKKKGNKLKPAIDHKGYEYISVYIGNKKTKKVKVHRLVATYYLPNPDNLPQINHKDGDPLNNSVSNLEWCTAAYNVSDGFKRGRITWNKGNASKERIYGYCKKYPRQIFWILTNNDFHFAKAFWGTNILDVPCCHTEKIEYVISAYLYHLQEMVMSKDPIKYIEKFI